MLLEVRQLNFFVICQVKIESKTPLKLYWVLEMVTLLDHKKVVVLNLLGQFVEEGY